MILSYSCQGKASSLAIIYLPAFRPREKGSFQWRTAHFKHARPTTPRLQAKQREPLGAKQLRETVHIGCHITCLGRIPGQLARLHSGRMARLWLTVESGTPRKVDRGTLERRMALA
jgi:hypothetical protein